MDFTPKYFEKLHEAEKVLDNGKKLIDAQYINKFCEDVVNLETSWQDIIRKDRNLKIGIVGGVKAGKSSFLNALLFNGRDVLPKAATPMTAALTRIVYAEKPYAKVTFYDEQDWEMIEKLSQEYDDILNRLKSQKIEAKKQAIKKMAFGTKIQNSYDRTQEPVLTDSEIDMLKKQVPEQNNSCRQLTDMVKSSGVDISVYLGTEKSIVLGDSMSSLTAYVGAEGKYTPIVKHIELGLHEPLLNDLEIIDTPGLNDPVISRSMQTKKFLINCDAVFLLSVCSQFLSEEDVSFMAHSLPENGIFDIVLVGSKFDSALLDHSVYKYPLKRAIGEVVKRLNSQARTVLLRHDWSTELSQHLKEALPPIFISALLYGAAQHLKTGKPLSKEEEKSVSDLQKHYVDFQRSADFIDGFANVGVIRSKKLQPLREKKDEILAGRGKKLYVNKKNLFLQELDAIQRTSQQNKETLQTQDKASLQNRVAGINRALDSSRGQIERVFRQCGLDASSRLLDIQHDIMSDQQNHRHIKETHKGKDIHHEYTTRHWFWKEHHDHVERVEWKEASVADAAINIEDFAREAKRFVDDDLRNAIQVEDISHQLKLSLVKAFNEGGVPFNEDDILGPVGLVMREITIPPFEFEAGKYENELRKEFESNIVKDDQVERLRMTQEHIMNEIMNDFTEALSALAEKINRQLTEKSVTFVDKVQQRLKVNMDKLNEQIEQKEESIRAYDAFIAEVTKVKLALAEDEVK